MPTELQQIALALGASPDHVEEGVRFYLVEQCVVGLDRDNLQPGWCLDAGVERFVDNPYQPNAKWTTYLPAWRKGPYALGVTDRETALEALRREVL